jgi:hypothetical protein
MAGDVSLNISIRPPQPFTPPLKPSAGPSRQFVE